MSTVSHSSVLSGASQNRPSVNTLSTKTMQSLPTEQQLKYLHLEAEVEVLLQQLQTLKQRRLTTVGNPKTP